MTKCIFFETSGTVKCPVGTGHKLYPSVTDYCIGISLLLSI